MQRQIESLEPKSAEFDSSEKLHPFSHAPKDWEFQGVPAGLRVLSLQKIIFAEMNFLSFHRLI